MVSKKENFFQIFKSVWYLDALLFWAIFSSAAIFMIWLLAGTTKSQLRTRVESHLLTTTQSTLFALESEDNKDFYDIKSKNFNWDAYFKKADPLLQILLTQNKDILGFDFVRYREGQIEPVYFVRRNGEESAPSDYTQLQERIDSGKLDSGVALSSWDFLQPRFSLLPTSPQGPSEYVYANLKNLSSFLPNDKVLLVIVFDAPSIRAEFVEIEQSMIEIISLAIVFATLMSLLIRRRSQERSKAIEEKLKVLHLLNKRDAVLAILTKIADEALGEEDLDELLLRMMKQLVQIEDVDGCYLALFNPYEEFAYLDKYKIFGVFSTCSQDLARSILESPAFLAWRDKLMQGREVVASRKNFPREISEQIILGDVQDVVLFPVFMGKHWQGAFMVEKHHESGMWESGFLDAFRLVAEITGSAYSRRLNDRRLRESSKMELLGRIAGGVAHEFNNILHMIGGNAKKLTKQDSGDISSFSKNIEIAVGRGSKIVEQLLRTARKEFVDLKMSNLNEIVGKTVALAESAFPESIKLKLNLSPQVPDCLMDEAQITQVLLNLVINARDAMNEKGEIEIVTGLSLPVLGHAQSYILCEVRDEGPGIPDEIKERIFDPFFTTKPVGSGTGLGLSTCLALLQQHDGWIEAKNRIKGRGAAFTFFIPIKKSSEKVLEKAPIEIAPSTLQVKKVLVADDELLCREILEDYFKEKKIEVLLAKDGNEVLKCLERFKDIDVMITDWSMPGSHGLDLIQKVRQIAPSIKIIVTSGFIMEHEVLKFVDGVIQKPFDPEEISRLLVRL